MPTPIKTSDLLGITPAPIQTQVLAAPGFELGLITGFAAGKTRAICALTMSHALRYPNAKILIGRKTYQEMRDTVKQPWFQMAMPLKDGGWIAKPKNWDYREGTNHAQLINGSQFFFSNFDDPLKFRNEEYSMVVIDQAEEVTEELWELILGRIRHKLVPAEGWQAVAAANDNGHNWMWRRFVYDIDQHRKKANRCPLNEFCMFLAGHPDEEGEPQPIPCSTRQFFHGTTLDNRHNLSRLYLANLLSKPKEWQKHFIYATMEGGAGRLLPDPVVVPHFDPPAEWPRYRAIDHALNSPACCLWIAVNNSGTSVNGVVPNAPYVYREYWRDHSSVDQHCERILRLSKGENVLCTIIDKSAFRRDQSRKDGVLISIADLYAEFGLFTIPSQGDPFPRVERIATWHNKGMVVSDQCIHLIRSFPEYYAEQSSIDGTYKIQNRSEFHAIDALGYGLMAIPQDSRSMVEVPDGVPAGLHRDDGDTLSERHNIAEWKRAKRLSEQYQQERSSIHREMVPAGEFWGEEATLENPGEVKSYDPYGGQTE